MIDLKIEGSFAISDFSTNFLLFFCFILLQVLPLDNGIMMTPKRGVLYHFLLMVNVSETSSLLKLRQFVATGD